MKRHSTAFATLLLMVGVLFSGMGQSRQTVFSDSGEDTSTGFNLRDIVIKLDTNVYHLWNQAFTNLPNTISTNIPAASETTLGKAKLFSAAADPNNPTLYDKADTDSLIDALPTVMTELGDFDYSDLGGTESDITPWLSYTNSLQVNYPAQIWVDDISALQSIDISTMRNDVAVVRDPVRGGIFTRVLTSGVTTNEGTIFSSGDDSSWSWQRQHPGPVNARWFDAGESNDQVWLQKAMDFNKIRGGGTVIIPPGEYTVSTNWVSIYQYTSTNLFHVIGHGARITSTERLVNNSSETSGGGSVFLVRQSTGPGLVEGLSIDAAGTDNNCLGASGNASYTTRGWTFRDCHLRGAVIDPYLRGGKGFAVQNGTEAITVSGLTIEDCDIGFSIEGSGTSATGMRGVSFTDTVVKDCEIGAWLSNGSAYQDDGSIFGGTIAGVHFIDCGFPGRENYFDDGDVNTSADTITLTSHGFYHRDAVVIEQIDGSTVPTGLAFGTRYNVVKLDANTVGISTSSSATEGILSTQFSTSADWINVNGHQYETGSNVVYKQGESSTAATPLVDGTSYIALRTGWNYVQLVAAADSAQVITFEDSDITLGTENINITGHGFVTGDDVLLALPEASAGTSVKEQMAFEVHSSHPRTGESAYPGTDVSFVTGANEAHDYNPDTLYYVIRIDDDNLKLARDPTDAGTGTAINITQTGVGTAALIDPAYVIDITATGDDYQHLYSLRDITGAGSGDFLMRPAGWGVISMTGAENMRINARITNTTTNKVNLIVGRGQNLDIDLHADVDRLRHVWNPDAFGTRGEFADGATLPSRSINARIKTKVAKPIYSLASVATTSGSAVVTPADYADWSTFQAGDVLELANTNSFNTTEVTISSRNSVDSTWTLDTSAVATGTDTFTRKSYISDPLIYVSSASDASRLESSNIEIWVEGMDDSVDLMSHAPSTWPSLYTLFGRVETGEVVAGMNQSAIPQFSGTARRLYDLPVSMGGFNFDGDTVSADSGGNLNFSADGDIVRLSSDGSDLNVRPIGNRVVFQDGGGIDVARLQTSGPFQIASSSWNSRHLQIGSYHLWVDSTGDLRIKSSAPSSDTDGTIVGTQN